jgi:hypothetical protein
MVRFIFEFRTLRADTVAKRLSRTMGIRGVVEYPTKVRFQIVAENITEAKRLAHERSNLMDIHCVYARPLSEERY